ncbi:hypothetical protein DSECCO2_661590 [anaerobic digester metagenome]
MIFYLPLVGIHIHIEDLQGAPGLRGDALDHLHGRRLSRAVRPEEPEYFPFLNPEGYTVDCDEILKPLFQVARYDDVADDRSS